MDRTNVKVLGLCETNWTNKGSFQTHENKLVLFAGKDEGRVYSHGVAIILSNETSKALLGYSPISDRLLKIRI